MKKNDSVLQKRRFSISTPTTMGLVKFFVMFFCGSLLVCIILAAATSGDSWKLQMFHSNGYTDMFMDFFNSIRDGGSSNVYTARNNIYPPLCILIFRLFSKMMNPSIVASSFKRRSLLQMDQISMMIYFIFAIICILSLLRLLESYVNIKNKGKFKLQASVLSYMMIISYPVMFCLERGNILILSVIFAMFFIFFKDAPNPILRELSYIALAISAGIKLYPAVFGLTLIIEKKYKEAIRTVIYGIIFVVGPFIFFIDEFTAADSSTAAVSSLLQINSITQANNGFIAAIKEIIENLLSFATKKKSSLNFSSVSVQNFVFMIKPENQATIAKIVCGITEVIALICAFATKCEWKKVFLLCYLMLNIPSASNSYALSFLLIPFFIFLFGTSERKKTDYLYILGFTLLLTPLPTLWYYYQSEMRAFATNLGINYNTQLNQYLGTITFQFIFAVIVIELLITLIKERKNVKASITTANAEQDSVEIIESDTDSSITAETDTYNESAKEQDA